MKSIFLFYVLLFFCFTTKAQQFPSYTAIKNLTYKIIPSAKKTWGYDIYNNDKLIIHQPSVPAMPGNNGFTTREVAEKVAKKIIEKIRHGENPPTISVDEMKELGVIPKQ